MSRMNRNCLFVAAAVAGASAFGYNPNGGILERKMAIPSRQIAVINRQSVLSADAIADSIRQARLYSSLPFQQDAAKAPATVELVDGDAQSALILFPEEFRAQVNIRPLAADGVASTALVERVEKELVRAGCYLMGTGYGPTGCITAPIRSVKELDGLMLETPSPEALTHVRGGQKNGIKVIQWVTYRHACQQGWAPPPTTEDQKRVWDEVHAPPTKPLKITYDKDKQKPVVK